MVGPEHALWNYLIRSGASADDLLWFRDNTCPPDIIGVNYYVTSERWLDHRPERYPQHHRGMADGIPCADIEASRALATPTAGIAPLLTEIWDRYRLPLAITEAHIDAEPRRPVALAAGNLAGARRSRAPTASTCARSPSGRCSAPSTGTAWSRATPAITNRARSTCARRMPRPTALAAMMRELAGGKPLSHPVLRGQGWWRRPGRFLCTPVATPAALTSISADGHRLLGRRRRRPILITGATGTLGRAFARVCQKRNLAYRLLSRHDMDIADPASVERALARYKPWALINTSGYVRVDDAEHEVERCMRENTLRRHDPGRSLRPPWRAPHHLLERPGVRRPQGASVCRERPARAAQRLRPQQGRLRSAPSWRSIRAPWWCAPAPSSAPGTSTIS